MGNWVVTLIKTPTYNWYGPRIEPQPQVDVPICNCVFSHGVVAAGSYYNHLLAGVTGFKWELVLLGISLMAGLVGISGIDTITRPTKKHDV